MLNPKPTSLIAAATDNATLVRAGRSRLCYSHAFNLNDAPVYVKWYDKATAPTSSDTPVLVQGVPSQATATLGAGSNLGAEGIVFQLGIGFRIVKGIANNDATSVDASEVVLNYGID